MCEAHSNSTETRQCSTPVFVMQRLTAAGTAMDAKQNSGLGQRREASAGRGGLKGIGWGAGVG